MIVVVIVVVAVVAVVVVAMVNNNSSRSSDSSSYSSSGDVIYQSYGSQVPVRCEVECTPPKLLPSRAPVRRPLTSAALMKASAVRSGSELAALSLLCACQPN